MAFPHRPSLLWAVSLLLVVSISGCGGCGSSSGPSKDPYAQWGGMSKEEWMKQREEKLKKEKEDEEAAKREAEAAKQEKTRKEVKEQATALAASKKGRTTPEPNPPNQAAPDDPQEQPDVAEPPRPDAFADWKEIDFLKARILDDPKLLPAVEYYGSNHVGDEAAADLLIQLLKPRVMANLRDQIRTERGKEKELNERHRMLTQAIVAALGTTATSKARQTLEGVIDGSFRTEADQAATDAAVKALIDNPCPENEAILFRVLTSAEQLRPLGQGEVTAAALRDRAVALLATGASSRFRVRLAEQLVASDTSEPMRRTYESIVKEPNPDNFEAQIVLYPSSQIDAKLKAAIERQFVQYGAEAIGYMLSFPEQRNRQSSTPDWPYQVAEKLWSPKFQRLLEARVEPATSLAEIDQVVMLASTIPTTAMRALVLKTLQRHWLDGPAPLHAAGLAGSVIHEPGFYPVLKMLLRQANTDRPELAKGSSKGRVNGLGGLVKARQERDLKLRQDWEQATEALLIATAGRFRAIGQSQADAMRQQGKPVDFSDAANSLPVELPPEARVVAAVYYTWPAGIPEKVTGVVHSAMEIRYARAEFKADPEKLSGAYRRKLSGYEIHTVPQGLWFECLKPGAASGRTISIDVVVRLSNPDPLRLPNEDQELVVDLLTIELADPAQEKT